MTTTYLGAATGTIAVAGDSGWVGIQLQAGSEYLFNIGNGSLGDPQVAIYNSSGALINAASGGGAGGPNNENSQIAFTPTSSGTYYVAASSASGTQTGNYALQAYSATYDFAGNVNTLGAITAGGSATGSLTSVGQSDWFKIQLTAGKEYVFAVATGALANTQNQLVSLYDQAGKLIYAGNDYEQLSGGQLAYIPTTTGNYFVGVSGNSGATGSFTLTAATPSFDFGDTPATAGSVTVGGSVNGNLTSVQQRDWFAVTLTAGNSYSFTVGGGTLGSNATVGLYNSSGAAVVNQISGGTGNGAVQAYAPTSSGTYYVEAGALFGATGSFTVTVASYTGTALGNVNTAGTITVGGTASGAIQVAGDSDWFKITLSAGKEYAFTLTDQTLTKGVVALYDANGNLLTQSNGTAGGLSQTTYAPTSSGTFFVGAAGALTQTGSYSLAVNTITPDYASNITSRGTLAIGSSTGGNISNLGQSDWFKVSLAANGHYVFDVNGALSNAQLSLYDSNGTLLSQAGGAELSYAPATAGSYFVAVGSSGTGTGSFTLTGATYSQSYPANSSTSGVFTSAATEVAAFQAGTLTSANAISDSLANVQANLDGLQTVASAGKLTAIHLTDAPTPTLTLTATQLNHDVKAISEIVGGYSLTVADSAANVASALDSLQSLAVGGALSTITLTDAGTPTLTISAAQLTSDTGALADISGNYLLVVGNVSAANAASLSNSQLANGIAVVDSAANVLANLDGLQTAASSGKSLTIHLTDSGVPALSVSETQYATDSAALADLTGSYGLTVTNVLGGDAAAIAGNAHVTGMTIIDSASNINPVLDDIEGVAIAGKLTSISLTDSGFVTLSITPTQLVNDAKVLNSLNGYFTLSIDASAPSATNLKITGIGAYGNTVVFGGNANQYSIVADGNGASLTVTDVSTGRSSIDHLNNVTAMQFSDYTDIVAQTPGTADANGNLAVTTGNITELYGAVFGRLPDVPGLAYYEGILQANPSLPLTLFAQDFLASPEYANNPAHAYALNDTGNTQFVTDSYNNLLHRAPETGAVPFYLSLISLFTQGLTPGTQAFTAATALAHAYVITDFSQSAEFLNDVTVTATTPSDSQHFLVLI